MIRVQRQEDGTLVGERITTDSNLMSISTNNVPTDNITTNNISGNTISGDMELAQVCLMSFYLHENLQFLFNRWKRFLKIVFSYFMMMAEFFLQLILLILTQQFSDNCSYFMRELYKPSLQSNLSMGIPPCRTFFNYFPVYA